MKNQNNNIQEKLISLGGACLFEKDIKLINFFAQQQNMPFSKALAYFVKQFRNV